MSYFELVCQTLKGRLMPMGDLKIESGEFQQAAVALILRDHEGEAEVLMIKRAEHPHDPWSGQLALPGGRVDAGDRDLKETVVRETGEEVGIDLDGDDRFLGRLDTVSPATPRLPPIVITPLVALAPPDATPQPNPEEVEEAFWLPVALLQQQDNLFIDRSRLGFGLRRDAPVHRVGQSDRRPLTVTPFPVSFR